MVKILICTLALSFFAQAVLADGVSMNSISLNDYGDFTQNWKLVTVRYRQDTQEMRFTYANDTAWASIKKAESVYPDGSVFAKVGFKSGIDPAFTSSIVPNGARRFQFMVKNSEKYKDTDGWGYALFLADGDLVEGDEKVITMSCHACHKIVPERNFVFSEPVPLSPAIKNVQMGYNLKKNETHLFFKTLAKNEFTAQLKKNANLIGLKKLDIVDGNIRHFFFSGTLDEVTPMLIKNLISTKHESGFVSFDQNTFKIIKFDGDKKHKCGEQEFALKLYEFREEWLRNKKKMDVQTLCYAKNNL